MKIIKDFFTDDLICSLQRIFTKENKCYIWIVGGAIRNFYLEKKSDDIDFACAFNLTQIEVVLKKYHINYFIKGKDFGTISIINNKRTIDITSIRKEKYQGSRFPEVEYLDKNTIMSCKDQNSLQELVLPIDAKRRDFSCNALYLNHLGEVIDLYNGLSDIYDKKLKFVGDYNKKIIDDPLRILRLFRFMAQYNFKASANDIAMMHKNFFLLSNLSKERIREEVEKILFAPFAKEVIILLFAGDVGKFLFNKKENVLNNFTNIKEDFILRLLFLNHNIEIEKKFHITKSERIKNHIVKTIIVRNLKSLGKNNLREFKVLFLEDLFFYKYIAIDAYKLLCYKYQEDIACEKQLEYIRNIENSFSKEEFKISGNYLISLAVKDVKNIKFLQKQLFVQYYLSETNMSINQLANYIKDKYPKLFN